jgi:hypothetical protein
MDENIDPDSVSSSRDQKRTLFPIFLIWLPNNNPIYPSDVSNCHTWSLLPCLIKFKSLNAVSKVHKFLCDIQNASIQKNTHLKNRQYDDEILLSSVTKLPLWGFCQFLSQSLGQIGAKNLFEAIGTPFAPTYNRNFGPTFDMPHWNTR